MAKIPAELLAEPAKLPRPQRTAEGIQDGAAAHRTQLELYDTGGKLRADLIRLQCAVLAAGAQPLRVYCPQPPSQPK